MADPANVTKKPWPFHAAKASWCCPLLLFGMMAFGGRVLSPLILDLIALVIIVAGFVFGGAAFSGIRKYGSKGIVAPALSGILCNSLLLLIFVTNFIAARARAKGV